MAQTTDEQAVQPMAIGKDEGDNAASNNVRSSAPSSVGLSVPQCNAGADGSSARTAETRLSERRMPVRTSREATDGGAMSMPTGPSSRDSMCLGRDCSQT